MIELQIDPLVLSTLQAQFPKPANSAKKALDKYLALLTEQIRDCELRGRSAFQIKSGFYTLSLSKQRHKGGQIGAQKIRLQNWLEQNDLELFRVVEKGSNLTEQLSTIKLTKLVSVTHKALVTYSQQSDTDEQIAALISDQQVTNKEFFDKLFPDIKELDQDEIMERYHIVPIDQRSLKNYLRWLDERATLISTAQRDQYKKQAELILRIAQHTDGYFFQAKKPSAFGRLYYEGVSVQNVNKELRRAMLGRCWEYDLRSAVFCWKMSYAKDCAQINNLKEPVEKAFSTTILYLTDKKDFTATVRFLTFQNDSNVPRELQDKLIKQAITAISFGARLNSSGWMLKSGEWVDSSMAKIIYNEKERQRFIQCDLIREFVKEQSMLDKVIFEANRGDDKEFFNGADVFTKSGRLSKAKVIAFMYQSYETDLMNIAEELIRKKDKEVIARIHDAIIAKQKLSLDDRVEIQDYLRQATGNKYWTFSQKELEAFEYDNQEAQQDEQADKGLIKDWFERASKLLTD